MQSTRFDHAGQSTCEQSSHPFAAHEAALQSLLRLRPVNGPSHKHTDLAVEALYDAAVRAAAGICRRIGLRPSEEYAREAVHEWICQLRPHAARGYQPNRPLFPYAYRALAYIVYGMARRARRERAVETASANEPADPADVIALRELHDIVRELPEGLRDTVILRYFDGLSSREVGHLLSLTVNAVNLRAYRGLTRLRSMINEG